MTTLQASPKIEINPQVKGGQPHIAGTRFTVKQIAVWHEYIGMSADEIATEYGLSLSDIYAALSYFFDHRAEILQAIQDENDLVESLKSRLPSKVKVSVAHG